jgi:hypothetical protein
MPQTPTKRVIPVILMVAFAVVTVVNISATITPLIAGVQNVDQRVAPEEPATPEAELVEDVGGITQITGIPVYFLEIVMVAVLIALLLNRAWAVIGAAVVLGIDIVLKIINMIAEISAGATVPDLALAIALIVVDLILIYFFVQERRAQRPTVTATMSSQTRQMG